MSIALKPLRSLRCLTQYMEHVTSPTHSVCTMKCIHFHVHVLGCRVVRTPCIGSCMARRETGSCSDSCIEFINLFHTSQIFHYRNIECVLGSRFLIKGDADPVTCIIMFKMKLKLQSLHCYLK